MKRVLLLAAATVVLCGLVALAIGAVPFDWSEVRVQQATIAALVVASGWFAGFLLREVSQILERDDRLRDMHRAVYSEISHTLTNLGSAEDLREFGAAMLERMERDSVVPFIPHERNDRIFSELVSDIHILPRSSIDPVVRYYSQLAALDALIGDMRGETFAGMDADRRLQIYRDYIGIKLRLLEYGEEALALIDAFAKGGRRRARRLERERRAAE